MPPLTIIWNVSDEIVSLGPITLRWYGASFAMAFLLGLYVINRIFKEEGVPDRWLDVGFFYLIAGILIGARLGHVFFYEWDYYQAHPAEIPMIWRGGLASHGAAIGIFVAMWLFSRWVTKKSLLWLLDRLVIPVALSGFFIRFGNLMNSEIVGTPTDLPWGFLFVNAYPPELADEPRHPVQLYEALSYLACAAFFAWSWWTTDRKHWLGYHFGLFMILIWGFRFVWEFFKSDQGGFAATATLSTGQWLSIPLVLVGGYFVWRSRPGNKKEAENP